MRQCGQEDVENGQGLVKKAALGAAALVGFGIWYAGQVNQAEESGEIEGQSSLWVAVGVAATIVVRHWTMPPGKTKAEGLFWTLLAFFCSGSPMILNQFDTHGRHRAAYRRRQQREKLCPPENQTDLLDGLTTLSNGKPTAMPK